jgi:hypothetical protein
MGWPKVLVFPDGMKVEVDSWEEIREARAALGGEVQVLSVDGDGDPALPRRPPPAAPSALSAHDRSLLEQFITAAERGILTQQLGQAIGAKGKGVRPALDRWGRKIGLVTAENVKAFEAVKRFDGRGLKMVEHYRITAGKLLGR